MNNFIEIIHTSIGALMLNKVRSFLTMLGVIIGVYAVVVLVSMVQGFKNYVSDQFNSLGSNLLFIVPGKSQVGKDPTIAYSNNKLDFKHIDLINAYAGDYVEEVAPFFESMKTAIYKTNQFAPTIEGTTANALSIYNIDMDKGRSFTSSEVSAKARVMVLGPEAAKQLFGNENPIGKRVRIESNSFQIIGVFKSKGSNYDTMAMVPDTTVKELFNVQHMSTISVKVKQGKNIDDAKTAIKYALLHDLKLEDFTIMSQEDILSTVQSILGVLTIGLAAIGGISLLVGGIGIMNIMLVSVTERTHEIGLRKAVGATSANIGIQFMIEAVILSISGGLIGLFLSWLTTLAVQKLVRAEVPWWAAATGIGFSLLIGVCFGTYPALNASKKDPIEALRFE